MSDECKTPLIELLLAVPADARTSYKLSKTHYSFIPVGHYCHEAAEEIERLSAGLLKDPLPVGCRSWGDYWNHAEPIITERDALAKENAELREQLLQSASAEISFTPRQQQSCSKTPSKK